LVHAKTQTLRIEKDCRRENRLPERRSNYMNNLNIMQHHQVPISECSKEM
jgi:hypothetical protein